MGKERGSSKEKCSDHQISLPFRGKVSSVPQVSLPSKSLCFILLGCHPFPSITEYALHLQYSSIFLTVLFPVLIPNLHQAVLLWHLPSASELKFTFITQYAGIPRKTNSFL